MPHIIVKIVGQSEENKTAIAQALSETLINAFGINESSISVSIEDVLKENWIEAVYKPDILAKSNELYKKPGYDPLY
ncbi:tautomerase family protein [Pantoea sp.]|uniref:tautomerase family protein n=1 Tax=Pantoea sp. TaxID=69393 RepID=UPI0031D2F110